MTPSPLVLLAGQIIDVQQMNKRRLNFSTCALQMHIMEILKTGKRRNMCHSGLRRGRHRVKDFEGRVGNSQVHEKEPTFGKQIVALPGPPRNSGHRGESNRLGLDPLSATLNSYTRCDQTIQ